MTADRTHQGERFRATVLARMDKHFRGKTFDIVREIHLGEDQVFRTIFGRPCRHGYVIRDRATGEEYAVGFKTLKAIHELYLNVNLPSNLRAHRVRRPRKTTDT